MLRSTKACISVAFNQGLKRCRCKRSVYRNTALYSSMQQRTFANTFLPLTAIQEELKRARGELASASAERQSERVAHMYAQVSRCLPACPTGLATPINHSHHTLLYARFFHIWTWSRVVPHMQLQPHATG